LTTGRYWNGKAISLWAAYFEPRSLIFTQVTRMKPTRQTAPTQYVPGGPVGLIPAGRAN
jgi:hypothetical protein